MVMFCPFLTARATAKRIASRQVVAPCRMHDDDDEDEDLGMPLPDWRDPDWGFDDEESEPEQGDFWFDSNDEENAL